MRREKINMTKKLITVMLVLCQVLFGTTYLVAADEAGTDIIVKNDDSGISDTKLYEVLLSQVDENKDGLLELSELQQTRSLLLWDEEITDISGLEYFTNLEYISLSS